MNQIRKVRSDRNLSAGELAKKVGTSQQQIYRLEKGERHLSETWLRRIAQALDCSPSDLLVEGDKPTLPADSDRMISLVIREIDVSGGQVGGGFATVHSELDRVDGLTVIEDVQAKWYLPEVYVREELRIQPDRARIIKVPDDSMEPTLHSDERVMINLDEVVLSPGNIYCIWDGTAVVVKRLDYVSCSNPSVIRIKSDSSYHDDYDRAAKEVEIIGRVVWSSRKF